MVQAAKELAKRPRDQGAEESRFQRAKASQRANAGKRAKVFNGPRWPKVQSSRRQEAKGPRGQKIKRPKAQGAKGRRGQRTKGWAEGPKDHGHGAKGEGFNF